jgi:glycosyltransferase involved in cell wall biosynthesis
VHIALINQWYPPESGSGGVAMHNYYFANACSKLGHRVTVIARRPSPDIPARHCTDGISVLRVSTPNLYRCRRVPLVGRQYRVVAALIYSWQVCQALATLHREVHVDVAEFTDVNAEGFFWRTRAPMKLAVRCQTPAFVLARYYAAAESVYDPVLLGQAERQVIRRADTLFAPSRDMAAVISDACQLAPHRFHVIPNALDTQLFSPRIRRTEGKELTILFVGRLERAKGIEVLAQAIPRVCQKVPRARFQIIGTDRPRPLNGSHRRYLEGTLGEYITSGQVELRGAISQLALLDAYHEADIGVVPSLLYESFSYTCAQAMACGLPVVASRIGGIPETLGQGECGVLVTPSSPQELSAALVDLCHHPAKREALGAAGRERAVTAFSSDTVARRNLDVYEQALSSRMTRALRAT